MKRASFFTAAWLLCLAPALAMFGGEAKEGEATFPLKEISVFEAGQGAEAFLNGVSAECEERSAAPATLAAAASKLKSAKPLYGEILLGDEGSGSKTSMQYAFILDESAGTGKGYDRLYFDLDHSGDPLKHPALAPQKDPPEGAFALGYGLTARRVFEPLVLPASAGESLAGMELVPRFVFFNRTLQMMYFTPAKIRADEIVIGDKHYRAFLGQRDFVNGRYDLPFTGLRLIPSSGPDYQSSPRAQRLMTLWRLGGRLWSFSATRAGDQLTVRAYQGDLGTLELGAGGRTLQTMEMQGTLVSKEHIVSISESDDRPTRGVKQCLLPVGDYRVDFLSVRYGGFELLLMPNYYSESGQRVNYDPAAERYPLSIRKGQPLVLDFSSKPRMLFRSPTERGRIKAGETVEVGVLLVEPTLNAVFRDIHSAPTGFFSVRGGSLEPKVLITRANGEKVAEGVMPFG